MNPFIVGIRFQAVGKVYHFDASQIGDLQTGDFVVVDTSRGVQLGEVVQLVEDPPKPPGGNWKPVQRKATPQDLVTREIWRRREPEALVLCREKAKEVKLDGVKFHAAEYSYDGARLTFIYSTDEGAKPDFTPLRRHLLRSYPHIQLDLHQVGPRDVAKLIGGMGACGLACRCCTMFLTDFSPISIKMAKEQGISLTPTEITGMCGRLRCCLIYEYQQYVEARKQLPRRNKRVVTPDGEGRVIDILPLQDAVVVEIDKGRRVTYQRENIEPWDELSALRRKAEAGCAKHPDGNCNCKQQEAQEKRESESGEIEFDGEPVALPPAPAGEWDAGKPQQRSSLNKQSSNRRSSRRSKTKHTNQPRSQGDQKAAEQVDQQSQSQNQQKKNSGKGKGSSSRRRRPPRRKSANRSKNNPSNNSEK